MVLLGCYLHDVNYNGADYGSGTEPMTVSMTISYDNALQTLTGADVGVGASIPLTVNNVATG
jgi:hypothetical protein